jgi:hypothetical protein
MRLSAIALATLVALSAAPAFAIDFIKIDIDPPKPKPDQSETPSKGDSGFPGKNNNGNGGGIVLTPEIVDALDVGNKPIVILDDGVGSGGLGPFPENAPDIPGLPVGGANGAAGNPGGGDVLVLQLACVVGAEGLTLINVGDATAPAGLRLRWQVPGAGRGTIRLDGALKAGRSALVPGVAAAVGTACGVSLVS